MQDCLSRATLVAIPDNCTLCVIKPHAIKSSHTGDMLKSIVVNGFQIQSLFSVHMTMSIAEELFGIYRGVFPHYNKMVEHLCSGPVLALMIQCRGSSSVVTDFREFCGPIEPDLGKTLRPNSLRALYGVNPIENAVHCTDLEEDGVMEVRYMFETLPSLQ
jgi:nucleoside-diphosphate kinase